MPLGKQPRAFKVGDKVLLDPNKATQRDLNCYGSSGKFGKVYRILSQSCTEGDVFLGGSNYHKVAWLKHASVIKIGGTDEV